MSGQLKISVFLNPEEIETVMKEDISQYLLRMEKLIDGVEKSVQCGLTVIEKVVETISKVVQPRAPKRAANTTKSTPVKQATIQNISTHVPKVRQQESPAGTGAVTGATSGSIGAVTFGRDLDGNFICPFPGCHKSFASNAVAGRHFKTNHTGVVFACRMCSETFNRKDNLKRHAMKKHNLDETMANAMLQTV